MNKIQSYQALVTREKGQRNDRLKRTIEIYYCSHGSSQCYNTRNGYLPRLPKAKTECGRKVSYFRFINDWMSLPVFLRKPMPCAILKKNLTNFLMDKHFFLVNR